ncbi:hypothetical protein BVRB_009050 [Beta vulgaris subsp. vulgaris]|uniref:Uncharacterized protein n=1 Tax=Beta vulgaris subsp. vulgaris TaxID=3555 RepID=A0A0J8B2L5_BETVV|nr:hypothetical protein BVRB_009050 [Beta vulgaris subsp. vulgaris]
MTTEIQIDKQSGSNGFMASLRSKVDDEDLSPRSKVDDEDLSPRSKVDDEDLSLRSKVDDEDLSLRSKVDDEDRSVHAWTRFVYARFAGDCIDRDEKDERLRENVPPVDVERDERLREKRR